VTALLHRHPKLAALLAGALSATGFEPLNLWPVMLACLAILILLIERAPDRRSAFLRGWLFGLAHFVVGLNWIAHAFVYQDSMPHWFGYGAVILLSLYLAVYPAIGTLAAWWGHRRFLGERGQDAAYVALFAACWLATEYLRATLFTGFAWNPLGAVWLPTGVAIASTLVGTFGLGAMVVLAAGAILLSVRRQTVAAAAIIVPTALIAMWGLFDRSGAPAPGAPLVRIVQPNIGQDEKYSAELEEAHFRTLAALSGKPRPAPRLIFWPEAAIPAYLDMEPQWRERIAALLGPGDLLMTGASKVYYETQEKDGILQSVMVGANNSFWVVTPDGRLPARYDKSHLVPYGEYLPMRPILSAIGLSRLVPGDVDYWPGPGPRSVTLPATLGRHELKMGGQICYEIIFPGHVVDRTNRPDFLFNPSNDAWFGSWGPVQHLAQARLRAIEEGMPIVRATPTGVSAVIDARGHVRSSLGQGKAGYIETALPPALPPTVFARLGNWASGLLMVALLGLAIAMRRGRRY
jgi:apolipoprotein N-acyltransferase